jgi:antitoxin (DNA-binding transcriptional repressor) of toxin-antitoxin stability system
MAYKEREMSVRDARSQFAAVIHDAAVRGTITYVTNRDRRVAAITPLSVAENGGDPEREHEKGA